MNNNMREDWIEVELGEVFETVTGNTPSKKEIDNYGQDIPFIKPPDITNSTIKSVSEYLSNKGKKKARVLPQNSILVTCIGNLGRIGYNKDEVAFNQQINAILPLEQIDYKFTFYQAQSGNFRNQLESLSTSTTVALVNKSSFNSIKIGVAPLPIQRAIVSKIEALFSDLDNGIANFKKAQEQLKIYRQAVLKKAFEGGFTNENVIEDKLPNGWVWKKISEISNVVRGGSPRPAGDPKYYDGNIPFLKVRDITKDNGKYLNTFEYTIKEAGLHKTRQIKPNTLLLSNSGATLGVPKICMIEATMNDGIAAFLNLDKRSNLYLYYFWESKTKELRNINMGAAQPNLNTDIIKNYLVPYCSFEEQTQIVQEIESRLSVCDKMEQSINESIEKAEALRQSILKKAFEGKLLSEAEIAQCKQAADYEPASELLKKIQAEKLAKEQEKKKKPKTKK